MSYRVLARKYRPETFDELIGQQPIARTLTRSFAGDRLAHAYLFSGPRGIGKTTTARLLAKLVNCERPRENEPCNECSSCQQIREGRSVDVIEIDGATNNSVDEVRELREQVQYTPAQSPNKVYIIDEVHMLSRSAFNALLKTLEEPPDHVLFIFATTEVEKVPDTILSRCQRFDFRLIPQREIVDSLQDICDREGIPVTEGALFLIAKFAEGSLRDAQSILDMMISYSGAGEDTIDEQLVGETWGLVPYEDLLEDLEALSENNPDRLLNNFQEHLSGGNDLLSLIEDLAELMRYCLLIRQQPSDNYLTENIPRNLIDPLSDYARRLNDTELTWMFDQLLDLHRNLQNHSRFQRELAEVGLVRICRGRPRYNLSEILERLESLEENTGPAGGDAHDPAPSRTSPGEETNARPDSTTVADPSASRDPSPAETDSPEPGEPATEGGADESGDAGDTGSAPDVSTVPSRWSEILEAVPVPAQAYLQDASKVQVEDGTVVVWFREKWQNHVEQLNREEHRKHLRQAMEEVLGESYPVEIRVRKPDPTPAEDESEPSPVSKSPDPEGSGDPRDEDGSRFLQQAKELFDVEKIERIPKE